jgi:CBS domain-containing protein
MNSEDIKLVTELIEKKDSDQLKEVIKDLHPADIAELCNELDAEDARFIYLLLDNETAADVLIEMDEDARKKFLEILPPETIAKRFVDYMDSDDAVDIIREMDEDKQEEVLSHIEDIEQAGDIVDLLKYDEDTAGGLMGTEMVIVNENWSMPECLREMRLQAEEMDEIYYVYVVDDDERLRGVFPLKKMITSPSVSKVKHVMKKDPISVHVDTPIEEVVQTIEKYDLVAVPVVDSIGRLVGRITVDDVMDEVREQAERDYQLASGLSQDVETDDHGNGHQVILFNGLYHLFNGRIHMDGNRVLLHHVFHLGNRRTGNHLFQWEYTAQTFIVVYHIYIIYLVHFFCLQSHFAQAFGHTPVLVHNHHFRTHQTTGGVFVVFQQVDDVACLFDVFNV